MDFLRRNWTPLFTLLLLFRASVLILMLPLFSTVLCAFFGMLFMIIIMWLTKMIIANRDSMAETFS